MSVTTTRVLAIETSGEVCSVALRAGGFVREDTRHLNRSHNEALLGMLDALWPAEERAEPLDEVIFGAGPGSFTGVRIGAAAAQALALAQGASMRAIDSLAAVAYGGGDSLAPLRVVSRRSRRDAYYVAGYRVDSSTPGQVGAPRCCVDPRLVADAGSLERFVAECRDVGSGWVLLGDELPQSWHIPFQRPQQACPVVSAATLIELADLGVEPLTDPSQALPRYVSGDHPWVRQPSAG